MTKTLYQPLIRSIYPDEKKIGRFQTWGDVVFESKEAAFKAFEEHVLFQNNMKTQDLERELENDGDSKDKRFNDRLPYPYRLVGFVEVQAEVFDWVSKEKSA